MNNLTEVKKDWKSIPYFKQYTPTKYYAILGCFIVCFELKAIMGWGMYRPYFFMYPLWKESLDAVLEYPILYITTLTKKGNTLNIPYKDHHKYFYDAYGFCENMYPFVFKKNVHFQEVLDFFHIFSNNYFVVNEFINSIRLIECEFYFLLFLNDYERIDKLIALINKKSKVWDMKLFNHWRGDYDRWLEGLISMTNDRDSFLKQIETNINSEKLRKLPRYNLIP